MEYKINVAISEDKQEYLMYLTVDGEEVAEIEISKEYYEASLKEFDN